MLQIAFAIVCTASCFRYRLESEAFYKHQVPHRQDNADNAFACVLKQPCILILIIRTFFRLAHISPQCIIIWFRVVHNHTLYSPHYDLSPTQFKVRDRALISDRLDVEEQLLKQWAVSEYAQQSFVRLLSTEMLGDIAPGSGISISRLRALRAAAFFLTSFSTAPLSSRSLSRRIRGVEGTCFG